MFDKNLLSGKRIFELSNPKIKKTIEIISDHILTLSSCKSG